jgi:hypothetical protein
VREEAIRSLLDMARDAVIAFDGNAAHKMAIEAKPETARLHIPT